MKHYSKTVKCQWSYWNRYAWKMIWLVFFSKRLNVNHHSLYLNCNYQLLIQQTQHVNARQTNSRLNFCGPQRRFVLIFHDRFFHCVKLLTFWLSTFFFLMKLYSFYTNTARATNHRRLISFNLFILIIFAL